MGKCILIEALLLNSLEHQAESTLRKRKNHNYHTDFSDPINRMLNAFEPGTYCRPHKHENPDKREVFIVLKGELGIVIFNESGEITESYKLSPYPGNPGIEIPPATWHMALALKKGTVAYEIKDGPYNEDDDKNFAPWSPEEGETAAREYILRIIEQAGF